MLWHKLIGLALVSLALTQFHGVSSNVASIATNASCQTNFTRVEDKCLAVYGTWFNWYEADRHCRSLGANLLSLQNQTQLLKIGQWVNATLPYTQEFWTSGNTLGQKGIYYWQSTGELARYLPWAPGQPQPNSGDCLALRGNYTNNGVSDYRLEVKNCSVWLAHVCEQAPLAASSVNTTSRICLKPGSYETAQVLV